MNSRIRRRSTRSDHDVAASIRLAVVHEAIAHCRSRPCVSPSLGEQQVALLQPAHRRELRVLETLTTDRSRRGACRSRRTGCSSDVTNGSSSGPILAASTPLPVWNARQRPPSRFTSHSPWKPGRRVWPVRSCCMAACLRSRFLAMSRSSPPSSASTSLNAAAMARCSGTGGTTESAAPSSSARDCVDAVCIATRAKTLDLLAVRRYADAVDTRNDCSCARNRMSCV